MGTQILKAGRHIKDEKSLKAKLQESLEGYLFVFPSVLIISVFGLFPVFFTLFVSVHKWRIKQGRFLGFDNFLEAFGTFGYLAALALAIAGIYFGVRLVKSRLRARSRIASLLRPLFGAMLLLLSVSTIVICIPQLWDKGDDRMFQSLRVTIWYSLGSVPVQIALGLLLAVLLDQKFKGKQIFRVIFLLPYIVPSVAAAAVFERLFSLRPESFANQVLLLFGMKPLQWLRETRGIFTLIAGWGTGEAATTVGAYWQTWAQGPSLALVSIMFFNYWVYVGYYALIFANGLSNIPRQLYEAAEVDGATKVTTFFRITLPLLSPTTYFLTLLGVIGTFKAFNHIFVLRDPSVRGAADPMSVYIFFTFFRKSRFGYAAAMSLLLLVIVLGLTIIQRRILEKRIHYGD
jgi:multiple sugar transport system permease protein